MFTHQVQIQSEPRWGGGDGKKEKPSANDVHTKTASGNEITERERNEKLFLLSDYPKKEAKLTGWFFFFVCALCSGVWLKSLGTQCDKKVFGEKEEVRGEKNSFFL